VAAHHAEASSFYPTGDAALDEFLQQIEAEPDNFGLRLAVARMAMQSEHKDLAFHEYKQALQDSDQVEQIVDDVTDLIESEQDPAMLKRLHRLLGDCYSRQKRFHDAMAEYKWTFSG
jgi:tetratricopeptide (TPR) repeat protein